MTFIAYRRDLIVVENVPVAVRNERRLPGFSGVGWETQVSANRTSVCRVRAGW